MSVGPAALGNVLVQRLDAVLGTTMSAASANQVSGARPDAVSQPGNLDKPGSADGSNRDPRQGIQTGGARGDRPATVIDAKTAAALALAARGLVTSSDTTASAPTTLGTTARAILALLAQYPEAAPAVQGRAPLWTAPPSAQPTGAPAQQAPARTPAPAPAQQQAQAPAGTEQKTEIKSQAAYERLLHNSGISVQWLWTDARGKLNAVDDNDVVRLEGGHTNENGSVTIKGQVLSISADRFTFRGTILIVDAPDKGRRCERTGDYEFRATGKRKYWRLQQMEACGGLTDYVDIYY